MLACLCSYLTTALPLLSSALQNIAFSRISFQSRQPVSFSQWAAPTGDGQRGKARVALSLALSPAASPAAAASPHSSRSCWGPRSHWASFTMVLASARWSLFLGSSSVLCGLGVKWHLVIANLWAIWFLSYPIACINQFPILTALFLKYLEWLLSTKTLQTVLHSLVSSLSTGSENRDSIFWNYDSTWPCAGLSQLYLFRSLFKEREKQVWQWWLIRISHSPLHSNWIPSL